MKAVCLVFQNILFLYGESHNSDGLSIDASGTEAVWFWGRKVTVWEGPPQPWLQLSSNSRVAGTCAFPPVRQGQQDSRTLRTAASWLRLAQGVLA